MPLKNILKSKNTKAFLGVAISAVVIGWLVVSVEWQEVWAVLRNVHYMMLVPATLLCFAHFFLRTLRWRFLLPDTDRPRLLSLFDALMVGNLAAFVLPLRAGEFMRPYMLTLRSKFSFSSCFVSVVIERFFDLSMVLLTFGGMVLTVEGIPPLAHKGAFSLSVMALALLVFMLVGGLAPDLIIGLSDRVLSYLPEKFRSGLSKFIRDFIHGAAVLGSVRKLAAIVVTTLCVWLSCFMQYYVYLFMFDMPQISFGPGISISIIVALAVAAPSAPGFVGVYQAGCVAAFALFGVDRETAVAYSIVTHIHQFVLCITLGSLVLLRNNLRLSELRKVPVDSAAST